MHVSDCAPRVVHEIITEAIITVGVEHTTVEAGLQCPHSKSDGIGQAHGGEKRVRMTTIPRELPCRSGAAWTGRREEGGGRSHVATVVLCLMTRLCCTVYGILLA